MIIQKIKNKIDSKINYYHQRCNDKILKSNWYHNMFIHLEEYEKIQKNSDFICIGSSPAKFAIDFQSEQTIKGANLAVLPETIYYDFQVLKNYHSFLKPGGTVILVLCPFTFCKDKYKNENGSKNYLNIRYYPILHRALIDNFDYSLFHKYVEEPMLLGKDAWKRLLKDSPKSTRFGVSVNSLSDEEMKQCAEDRVKGWMKEFGLKNLDPLDFPSSVNDAIEKNIRIYQQMKEFIAERGYKAIVIIPPFSKELTEMLPASLIKHNIIDPLEKVGLPYISYIGEKKWMNKEYYLDAFLMNSKGRKLLTHHIISRINENI